MSVSSPAKCITIFLSYATDSSRDRTLRDEFLKHFSLVQHHFPTLTLYTSDPPAGSLISQCIEDRLHQAHLILLFISRDYFASSRCYEGEMQLAMAHFNAGTAHLIPILVRPVDWEIAPLRQHHPLPSSGTFITRWPDRDAAWIDVMQGIRQAIEKFIVQEPPPSSTPIPICDPPYSYDDLFTDREAVLEAISSFFSSTRPRRTSILALSGIGGIGKTAIALEYCYNPPWHYHHILWFNTSSHTTLGNSVRSLADRLSLPGSIRQDETQLFATIKHWLRDQPNWLLVLDQLEELTLIDLIVPPLSGGHVLVTTRIHDMKQRATRLPIPFMEPDAGALFLLRRTQILPAQAPLDQAPVALVQDATNITCELDGFPLALDQVGAYLEHCGGDLSQFFTLSHAQRTRLLHHQGQASAAHDEHQEVVAGSSSLAFEPWRDVPSLDLLHLLAFLQPDLIPIGLLTSGADAIAEPLQALLADPLALHEALAALRHSSLIRDHADKTIFRIPRIVQDVLVDQLSPGQQRFWAQQAVSLVNQAFPEIRFDTQTLCERYLPQAHHCATLISRFSLSLKEGVLLLERLGSFYIRHASYAEAETALRQALHLSIRYHRRDVLDTAQILNSLGRLSHRRARYRQAEAFHQRALTLREHARGPDDPKTVESLHNLALVYGDLGRYHEAERLYLRVLAVEEHSKGPHDPDVADTLNNLGLIYSQMGRYEEAERAYRRARAIYKRAFAANHPNLAYPLNGLGALEEKRGRHRQAEKYYQQALKLRQHAFGEMHPNVARSINKLAGIALLKQDYQEAEKRSQQALSISEQTLGARHPDVATVLNDLAFLATRQGQFSKAWPLYRRALRIYKLVLGPEHPSVASVLNNLGQLARLTAKEKQAEAYLQRALAIREKVLDPTHPSMAQSLSNLADLLSHQGRYEQAEPLFQRAFDLYLQLPAPQPPNIAHIPERYASLLEQIGKSEQANALREAQGNGKKHPQ